ncbi:MAG: TspO and like protein [Sphingomonas bacterium]|nr:TspO/MBR family protein [Sphingomonas bacterium]MDB5688627.1 TspO and like protein [Sphingomonas bacterium]
MGQLASSGQLRMALVRRALIAVPLVLLLGMLSGVLANSGYDNPWFAGLAKPAFMPPAWAFPVAWTILYVMQGLALAIVWQARGARGRGIAAGMFGVQLALNLAWSPLFFAAHRVHAALWLIGLIFVSAVATTILFRRIRQRAGLLMLPYLAWLLFAAALNYGIAAMNPGAEKLAPAGASTQITL